MAIQRDILGIGRRPETDEGPNVEEYNQIDPHILACFPPDRYPVDLYRWREDIQTLRPVYRAGCEVDRRLRERVLAMSEQGALFFSRNQIAQYAACVACHLDTALEDPNLTWDEKALVFVGELTRRQDEFFGNPMSRELESLTRALSDLCVHLVEDSRRMSVVAHHLHRDLAPERRRINGSLMALAVYLHLHRGEILLEVLETVALGFFVYDIGMVRVSPMMIARPNQLTPREQRAMREHPRLGLDILSRLNLTRPEIREPVSQHHERLNGTGYPGGLSGGAIGHLGRIAAVADSYSAMVTGRAMRQGLEPIHAAAELVGNERHYDQTVCRALVRFLQTVPSTLEPS
ncbi:HD domain-containing protein [Pseudodesulfovibrio sp. F-1]|uniref:HD domain-containing protein n=1 Tax=Pseudodesulfovibrio alkaliphilus TaxID=2661613 RepID=A0A7K1KNG7_9BACT|nr:HD domain-containing phosphohydrolase [Pseudodesulfovibrio alkaliphilus]MUM77638.1 HD domain-containing protein [Pseudodesulfovibrio alkaliphilus]